jgi:hypothetical protein
VKRNRGFAASRIAAGPAGILVWVSLAAAPLDVLRECAAKLPPERTGIKLLEVDCPQLEGALGDLGLNAMLYDGWREHLNRDALNDLANLADGYGGARPNNPPDIAALPGILDAMAREQTPTSKSWWDAFKAWLKGWLGQHADSLNWLDRWFERLGQSVTLTKVISYSLVTLVILAALAVIVNEFKAAGRARRAGHAASVAGGGDPAGADPAAQGAEPIAPADTLAALLRRLVDRLMQTRRLDSERSLTHRELVARSVFDSDAQRAVFARVARTAESLLYGSRLGPARGSPEQLNSVLEDGRTLLAELSAPPGQSAR